MFFKPWLGNLTKPTRGQKIRKNLRVERLEDRSTPAASTPDLTFNADGIFAQDFGTSSGRNDGAEAVVVQPDGKAIVAGFAQRGTTNFDFVVARLNRDGTLDTSFANGTGFQYVPFDLGGTNEDRARAVALQSDGKIVVAGFATTATGTDFAVCRLTNAGILDDTFDTDGKQTIPFDLGGANFDVANDLVIQADGRIVIAGSASTTADGTDFAVCRLNGQGALDNEFDTDGKVAIRVNIGGTNNDVAEAVALTSGDRIVVAGTAENSATISEVAVCQLTTIGAPDATFATGGIDVFRYHNQLGLCTGRDVAVAADGKLVVIGKADSPTATDADLGVARLTPNGQFDPTFSEDGRISRTVSVNSSREDSPEGVLLQPDGKILIAGFGNINIGAGASDDVFLLRLQPDGTNDLLFNDSGLRFYDLTAGTGNNQDTGTAVALGAEGIVIAGTVLTAANGTDLALLRAVRDNWVVVAQAAGAPTVRVLTTFGTELYSFDAFDPTFRGGVRIAAADINGDGAPEIFCAPGPGRLAVVRIFDGFTLQMLREIPVISPTFKNGVNLTLGDVLGTGNAPELIVAPGSGITGKVEIYDPTVVASPIKSFVAYTSGFRSGVRVTTAETNVTGKREIVVGKQTGSGLIRVFDAVDATPGTETVLREFIATTGSAGVFVSARDVNNDGRDDIIVTPATGQPLAKEFNLVKANDDPDFVINSFKPFATNFRNGGQMSSLRQGGAVLISLVGRKSGTGQPVIKVFNAITGALVGEFQPLGATLKTNLFVFMVNR